jgi:hypothetical protein
MNPYCSHSWELTDFRYFVEELFQDQVYHVISTYVKAPEINKKLFSQNFKFPIKIEKKLLFSIRMFDVYSLNFLGPWKSLCDLLRVRISKFS